MVQRARLKKAKIILERVLWQRDWGSRQLEDVMQSNFKHRSHVRLSKRITTAILAVSFVAGCVLADPSNGKIPAKFSERASGFDCDRELPRGNRISRFGQYTLWVIGPLGKSERIPDRERYLMIGRAHDLNCDFFVFDSRKPGLNEFRTLHDGRSLIEFVQFHEILRRKPDFLQKGAVFYVFNEGPEIGTEFYLMSEDGVFNDGGLIAN